MNPGYQSGDLHGGCLLHLWFSIGLFLSAFFLGAELWFINYCRYCGKKFHVGLAIRVRHKFDGFRMPNRRHIQAKALFKILKGKAIRLPNNSKTPPTAMPKTRSGKQMSHTNGYKKSARRARGQQKRNNKHQSKNVAMKILPTHFSYMKFRH